MIQMSDEAFVKQTYPDATAVYGSPYSKKGWYVTGIPNLIGRSQSPRTAWRKAAEHVRQQVARLEASRG